MSTGIMVSDDEDDLRRRVRIVARVGFIAFAVIVIALQQQQGAFSWQTPVAHADSRATVCAFREELYGSSGDKKSDISFADDPCVFSGERPATPRERRMKERIRVVVSGYPLEAMVDHIASEDSKVAGFLVGIAKKESDWGKHAPEKDGLDCYNYWGYKGDGGRGSVAGYACFDSIQEAVGTVGGRLSKLVHEQHRDTPSEMLVWKCGSSCEGHSAEGIRNWVGTVEKYYGEIVLNDRE